MWHWYLKILYLKSQFRHLGAEIKISSDLLENKYISQFESAEYESEIDILQFFNSNLYLGKFILKL